ncbi:MAG: histidine phosphatase family protein [Candidatus Parcubacteria bacterium]|nr:histidine phosphatase family protein [Candidatus Parcubacteria bacterium]
MFQPEYILVIALVVIFVIFRMRPRRFYLVRHGETLMNAQHIKQGADGSLSERGRRQAEKVGVYLKRFPIQRILSSPYPRAKETTEIINAHLKVPTMYSPLLVERKNPSEIIGKDRDDAEVKRIVDQIDLAYHKDDYRFSDEENFMDLKKRARKCLNLLARQGAREMCIVTHHVFLKALIAYLLYRERLNAGDFIKLSFFNISDNAGITICEFHPWKIFSATRGWEVISYNEQAVDESSGPAPMIPQLSF